jgi:hypothetical protein
MVRVETAAPTTGVDVAVNSVQKSMPQPTTTQQACKSYRPGMFRSSYRKYEHDLKRHAEQDWSLVQKQGGISSCAYGSRQPTSGKGMRGEYMCSPHVLK